MPGTSIQTFALPKNLGPQDQCAHQLFEQQAERIPEAIAVIFKGTLLPYRRLNQRANQQLSTEIEQRILAKVTTMSEDEVLNLLQ